VTALCIATGLAALALGWWLGRRREKERIAAHFDDMARLWKECGNHGLCGRMQGTATVIRGL
jgi:hypothetical protein